MRRLALVVVALLAAGCGGSDPPAHPRLSVAAAGSLQAPLGSYSRHFGADVRFVSSAELPALLRSAHRPDVIAAAAIPQRLYADGLVEKPQLFAVDRLVLAVPAGRGRRVNRVEDLAEPGIRVAVPPAATTAGRYARRVVARLPAAAAANLRTSAHGLDDVMQGRADAAIVFFTMARTAEVLRLDFWDGLRPRVGYRVAVVKGAALPARARAFVHGLRRGAGRDAVIRAGLTPR
jgi:molybdate transport system substrate-binding protein